MRHERRRTYLGRARRNLRNGTNALFLVLFAGLLVLEFFAFIAPGLE